VTAPSPTDEQAVVVFSGGQDSTTCLYWALQRFGQQQVLALSFDYGQRHRIELEAAAKLAAYAGVRHQVLPIDTFAALGGNALIDEDEALPAGADASATLPTTFIPGRNLIFMTFAAAFAWQRGVHHLVTGVAQTDYSGYPDCREHTMEALQDTLRKGMETDVTIHTPLMHLSKKETVLLAMELGALEAMAMTHTCYAGAQPPCGECAACTLRAKGFAEAGIDDPLLDL